MVHFSGKDCPAGLVINSAPDFNYKSSIPFLGLSARIRRIGLAGAETNPAMVNRPKSLETDTRVGYNSYMDEFFPETSQSPENSLTAEQRRTLEGLLFILHHESDTNLRLKAVRALSRIEEMSALRTLAELALYEEDQPVRLAAQQELINLFGEESDSFLESIRTEFEGEDEVEDEPFPISPPRKEQNYPQTSSDYSYSPVVQEERTPLWLWVALSLFILGGIVLFVLR